MGGRKAGCCLNAHRNVGDGLAPVFVVSKLGIELYRHRAGNIYPLGCGVALTPVSSGVVQGVDVGAERGFLQLSGRAPLCPAEGIFIVVKAFFQGISVAVSICDRNVLLGSRSSYDIEVQAKILVAVIVPP